MGSHLVEVALARGYDVWAAIRQSSSRQWLQDSRINFIILSLNNAEQLRCEISDFAANHGGRGWDYVVHAAGATKAVSEEAFMRANYEATQNLAATLVVLGLQPRRFVLMSSLSAVPMKNGHPAGKKAPTAYGRSKLKAEDCVKAMLPQMDSVILRPTGVYGPREKDYFLMAKSIRRHMDFAVGFKPQQITFIYVKDLCEATLLALANGPSGATYQLSDGRTYSSRDFSRLLQWAMGVRRVVHVTAPLWLLCTVCHAGQWWSNLTHRMIAINKDKYHILKQRDWRCDISKAVADLGYEADYDLERGVAETVAWYKEHKWI